MFNYLTELMLSEYFTVGAIFGRFLNDFQRLFFSLANIFLVSDEDAEELFEITENDRVKEIVTEKDYLQYKRINQYSLINGLDFVSDAKIENIIDIKGSAILSVRKLGEDFKFATSEIALRKLIKSAADCGLVMALNILGVLLEEGIIYKKDKKAGMANLTKAASWNSEEGLMAALYYDENYKIDYLNQMIYNLEKTSHPKSKEILIQVYGSGRGKPSKTYGLLQKSFERGILKNELYSKQYSRILYSNLLSYKDKERILFSMGKELVSDAANLPLKLSCGKQIEYSVSELAQSALIRKDETEFLTKTFENADLCTIPTYKPACIVSDSNYVFKSYAKLIESAFINAHVERIEISDLTEYDLEPTKNNIFIRGCDEDSANVYLLFFRGKISESILENVKNFLLSEKRAKFRLSYPSVCLNFSPILPICFCDRTNANLLRQFCEVLTIGEYSNIEKEDIAYEIFNSKCISYRASDLELPHSFFLKLINYTVDDIEKILEEVVRDNRKGTNQIITDSELSKYLKVQQIKNSYGFGDGRV